MWKSLVFLFLVCQCLCLRIIPDSQADMTLHHATGQDKNIIIEDLVNWLKHPGESHQSLEALANDLVRAGIWASDLSKYEEATNSGKYHLYRRQKALNLLAQKEAGLKSVSAFGKLIPKIPKSYVEKVLAMNHSHIYRMSFIGQLENGDVNHEVRRAWVPKFAKEKFTAQDYFKQTDKHAGYIPLGEFDRSNDVEKESGRCNHGLKSGCSSFDPSYWQTMVSSDFVLCPGGDLPWSYRYYETMLTKAIPLMDSYETDWNPASPVVQFFDKIGYEHMMTSGSLVYDPEMANRNFQKFIKYQTFVEGDNTPPPRKREAEAGS